MESKILLTLVVLFACVIGLAIMGPVKVQMETGKAVGQQTVSTCLFETHGSLLDCFKWEVK